MTPALHRLRRWIHRVVIVLAALAVLIAPKLWSGERSSGVPYGVVVLPGTNAFAAQDFAYNLNYLRQIAQRTVAHPYRLDAQEHMVRTWYARTSMGLVHGYSPVALVMASPLLMLPVEWAYALFTFFHAVLFVLLTVFYLLPRMKNSVQGRALLASFCSYALLDIWAMGQTAIVTTSILAAGAALLRNRSWTGALLLRRDLILGGLFFVLAAKPSIALILAAMLIGERVWRPLGFAAIALASTWALLADHYGGFWIGLRDYAWLLNHYCQADATPFMRPGLSPEISTNLTSFVTKLAPGWNGAAFHSSRVLFEGLIFGLVILRWSKRISFSTQFQGLLWTFLLFCPYLLVTEDLAVCLLAVEGPFFRPGPGAAFKVLLVFLMVNLWLRGLAGGLPFVFPVKLTLAVWWLADLIFLQRRFPAAAEKSSSAPEPDPLSSPSMT